MQKLKIAAEVLLYLASIILLAVIFTLFTGLI